MKDEQILDKLNSLQVADEVYVFESLKKVDDVNSLNFPVSNNYLWPICLEGERLIFHAARLEQLEVGNRYGTGQLIVMKLVIKKFFIDKPPSIIQRGYEITVCYRWPVYNDFSLRLRV
ncbi:hypothetical protein [Okeania sp. KiyG1]|uniref:hypothetical protein n=1 Tax=Okeania sp. KiyG1 TaxID=2720165 RepID=UPI001920D3B8|nr:hypothetical protein [Okeania sp. KiyG1]GGA20192.1 hypothetical protein CYANOKiyG1_35070 [Okeania sp. KiyG1]